MTANFVKSISNVTANAPMTNAHGATVYALNIEERAHQLFTMGLLNGEYYTGDVEKIVNIVREEMQEYLSVIPYRATLHAVYAAETQGMKLMPTIWLVYLSTLEDKTWFKAAFNRIIGNNPKLLYDFMTLARKGGIRTGHHTTGPNGLGRSVRNTINRWAVSSLNDYNVTRYTGKLEDVFHLSHLQATTPQMKAYLDYIFRPYDKVTRKYGTRNLTFPRALAQEAVITSLNNGVVDSETLRLIEEHRFQLEELKHAFTSLNNEQRREIFMVMVPNMSYAALIGNLATVERMFATRTHQEDRYRDGGNGLQHFKSTVVDATSIPRELIDVVTARINSFEAYKRSRMLPFGLLSAYNVVITQEWKNALSTILGHSGNIAFADVPAGIKIMTAADTSGSMGAMITSSLRAVDIASYLSASISMSVPGSRSFATASYTTEVKMDDNLISNAKKIEATKVGMGTMFESLLTHYNGEQFVILVTDGVSSGNFEAKWASLPNKPLGAKLIIWRVSGASYFHKVSNRPDILAISGYSDGLMRSVASILKGETGKLNVVDGVTL